MNPLDIRDIAIIDALPVYDCEKIILNVGCGEGRIDYHLAKMGYRVFATDVTEHEDWIDLHPLTFHTADIFDISTFPCASAPIVLCSQVLEHLTEFRQAVKNLIRLTEIRLIITIPYWKSFHSRGHINYWKEHNVGEFNEICYPYSVAISKILTKPEDIKRKQAAYLLIIDKRQKFT